MNNEDGNLVELKRRLFENEKAIQRTVEKNLKTMLNLTLIDSEFSFGKSTIDTLAFDDVGKTFVIIEYKIKEDKNIIYQALNYISQMKKHKPSFLLAYSNKMGQSYKHEANWDNTRVLLIAPKFHDHTISLLGGLPSNFEVWKIYRYQRGAIELKRLKDINNHIVETCLSKPPELPPSCRKYHLNLKKCNKNIIQIGKEIDKQIRETYTNVKIVCPKSYMSFKVNNCNFIRIQTNKDKLLVYLPIKLDEMQIPQPSVLTIIKKKHRMGGDSQIIISMQSEIVHLMKLVKQSYERTIGIEPRNPPPISREHEILSECNPNTRALYDEIKSRILKLGNDIDVYGTKHRIAFKAKRRFVMFRMAQTKMRIYLPITNNELQRIRVGNLDAIHGSNDVRVMISSRSEIPSLMRLVEYSYNRHADNGATRTYQDKS